VAQVMEHLNPESTPKYAGGGQGVMASSPHSRSRLHFMKGVICQRN
jgi:hypothetical protein